MFWGMILRGPPVAYKRGVFIEPPRAMEIYRSFHISKGILFNPRDFFADGASAFVRVLVNNSRHSIEICRMYNNRSGMTQVDLDLTFTKGDIIAFFTSIHGEQDQESNYGTSNYYPEIHLSGYYLEAQHGQHTRSSSPSAFSDATQTNYKFALPEGVTQSEKATVIHQVARPATDSKIEKLNYNGP